MIEFPEICIDESALFERTKKAFFVCVDSLLENDPDEFRNFFGNTNLSELEVELYRLSLSKNFEVEDVFYFDQTTPFHIYSQDCVFTSDGDGDRKNLAIYTLMLNLELEAVDDFLSA